MCYDSEISRFTTREHQLQHQPSSKVRISVSDAHKSHIVLLWETRLHWECRPSFRNLKFTLEEPTIVDNGTAVLTTYISRQRTASKNSRSIFHLKPNCFQSSLPECLLDQPIFRFPWFPTDPLNLCLFTKSTRWSLAPNNCWRSQRKATVLVRCRVEPGFLANCCSSILPL